MVERRQDLTADRRLLEGTRPMCFRFSLWPGGSPQDFVRGVTPRVIETPRQERAAGERPRLGTLVDRFVAS